MEPPNKKKKKQHTVQLSEKAMHTVLEDDVEGFKKAWPTTKELPKDILHTLAKACAIDLMAFLLSTDSGYDCPSVNLKAGTGTTPLHIIASRAAQEMLVFTGSKNLNNKAPNHNYFDPDYNRHHIFNEEKKQYEFNGFVGHAGIKILLKHGADASIVDNSKPREFDQSQKMTPYDVYVLTGGNPYKEDWIQISFPVFEATEKMAEMAYKLNMLLKEKLGSREDKVKEAEKFIASKEFQQMMTEKVQNLPQVPQELKEQLVDAMKSSIIQTYVKEWDEMNAKCKESAEELTENARLRAMLEEKAVVLKLLLDAENAAREKRKLPKRNIKHLNNNNRSMMQSGRTQELLSRFTKRIEELEAILCANKSSTIKKENGSIDGASSSSSMTNSANNNK
jgi:hypothetical protein